MNFLKKKWIEQMKENKDPFAEQDLKSVVYYPTGFDELDFRNGTLTRVTDISTNKEVTSYYQGGVAEGTLNAFIGPSGSGKTALAVQSACNIANKVNGTVIIHDDVESATDISRLVKLSGRPVSWLKETYMKRDVGVTTESFFDRVKSHATMKVKMKDELMYDTGKLDEFNQPLKVMVPTVWILDSLANLMPEKNMEEEGTGTNMSAAQIAKGNSNIFKKLIPLLSAANIIMFIINHIGVAIQASMYAPPKKQVNYLKQGESIPGGNTVIYLCNNIFKIEAKAAYKDDDKYKIEGFPTDITIVKSRSNRAGQKFEMIFSNGNFSQIMSKFHMAKDHGIIKGAAFLELEGYPTKFRNSNFAEKYMNDEEFRTIFNNNCNSLLESFADGTGNATLSQESWVELLEKDIKIPEGIQLKEILE